LLGKSLTARGISLETGGDVKEMKNQLADLQIAHGRNILALYPFDR